MALNQSSVFANRRQRLIEELDGRSILISNLVNVRYLTGFTGSNAFLLANSSLIVLLTDGRYTEQAADQCPDVSAIIRSVDGDMTTLVGDAIADNGIQECLIESSSMTVAMSRQLHQVAGEKVTFVDSTGIVQQLRAIKDELEIETIRRSIEINEKALLATLENWNDSWSELELAWELERQVRSRGGSGFSFDPIVAAGPTSALPHYHPADVRVADHPFLLIDWGTSYQGYASDLTRMVAVKTPPEKITEIHKVVSAAKQAAAETVRDGVELKIVDNAARKVIADAGYGEFFNHGTGHGFGLEIHESPYLSPAFEGHLKSGTVITIEPGIYLPQIGGVRLEDDYLVTTDGCQRMSTLADDFLLL